MFSSETRKVVVVAVFLTYKYLFMDGYRLLIFYITRRLKGNGH